MLRSRFFVVALLFTTFLPANAQQVAVSTVPDSAPTPIAAAAEVAPRYSPPLFVGSYCPDGKFRTAEDLESFFGPLKDGETLHQRKRPEEVPPWVDLRDPHHVVLEDFAPPNHASTLTHRKSQTAAFVSSVVTFAYGYAAVLQTPTHVVTDSKQRVIVSDPRALAIHVLGAKSAFSIAAGEKYRLQYPDGIAVDGEDNLYVADPLRGVVLVYDREGRYVRSIGTVGDDRIFVRPTGIAVDGAKQLLYVLDSPAGEVVVLDLKGNVLQRAGSLRRHAGVELEYPTEIALTADRLAVLDSYGARVQVFDREWHRLGHFTIGSGAGSTKVRDMGLAMDASGNIYLSNGGWDGFRIYHADGQLVGALARFGEHRSEFNTPSGIWIDAIGRIFVADTSNSRVHMFQPLESKPASPSEAAPDSR